MNNKQTTSLFAACRWATVTLAVACLSAPAAASVIVDNFEANALGVVPSGWGDAAAIDPTSTVPKPSAVVVGTTNALGNPTLAVATQPKVLSPLPSTGPTQGIYRAMGASNFYSTTADVRIDRFSDTSNFDCGCPPEVANSIDWAMQVGFMQSNGTLDPSKLATVALVASSKSHDWRLLGYTANVVAEYDLGVPITLGAWYTTQINLDVATGNVHSRITDTATGTVLGDRWTALPGWDPAVDGVLNLAGYLGGELTAVQVSSLAVIDNITLNDTPVPEPGTTVLLASALVLGAAARRRLGHGAN